MIKKLSLLLLCSIAFVYASNKPLVNFVKTVDWSFMGDKTEFSLALCSCPVSEGGNGAGMRARIAEPITFLEFTNTPWNVVAIEKKFDKSITRKQGSSRGGSRNRRYAHSIAFAPLGALNFIQDTVCFERFTSLSFLYWSEIIPTQTNDLMALFAQGSKGPFSKIWFNNPIAGMMCMADCVATTYNKTINSMHWCAGCAGTTANNTAYGSGRAESPLMGAHAQSLAVIDDLHYGGLLAKVSNASFTYSPVKRIPNSTCGPSYFPVAPKTQYALNLAYPTVWDATQIGKASFTWANFKNKSQTEDDVAFWLWAIKDTCIGGAKCKSMFTKEKNSGN